MERMRARPSPPTCFANTIVGPLSVWLCPPPVAPCANEAGRRPRAAAFLSKLNGNPLTCSSGFPALTKGSPIAVHVNLHLSVSTQSPLPFIRGGSSDVVLVIFGFLIQFDSIGFMDLTIP